MKRKENRGEEIVRKVQQESMEKFISLGLDSELLKKPAIFHSCMEEYFDKYSEGDFSVVSNDDGSYKVGKIRSDGEWTRYIEISPDGQSLKGHFNEFGHKYDYEFSITKEGLLGSGKYSHESVETKGLRKVIFNLPYTPECELPSQDNMLGTYLDFGFLSFKNLENSAIQLKSSEHASSEHRYSMNEIMNNYDSRGNDMVELYPQLDGYFNSRRTQVAQSAICFALLHNKKESVLDVVEEDIDEYFSGREAEMLKRLLEMDKNRERDVKLIKRLQRMLNKSLDLVKKVKGFPFLGFLFGKEINAVEKAREEEKADGPEFDE